MKFVHARQALMPKGWLNDITIAIGDDGRIAQIGGETTPDATSVDVLLPAPVNLHSHSFQRAMSGLTEARGPDATDSFWTWRRLMYRFLDQLTPDQVEVIAAQVFLEMLEAGYSSVAEFHYLHHAPGGKAYDDVAEMAARIVSAAEQTGIGLTLLPVMYNQSGCDGRPLEGGQQRFGNTLDRYKDLYASSANHITTAANDYNIGTAPHSLRAVSQSDLAEVQLIDPTAPIHMHLAEQVGEVEEVKHHYGARPVEWLLGNADICECWCLIHVTQMTDDETTKLAAAKAVAGLCPITESSLGDGIFNGTKFTKAGGRLGVGSDSNIHIALFEELATLEYSQRLRDRSRAALASPVHSTGRVLYDHALAGGAQATGRDTGQITQGQFADMVGISTQNEFLCDRKGDTILDSLVFTGRGRACITDVWSAGRHMVREGKHVKRDVVVKKFKQIMQQLGQDI